MTADNDGLPGHTTDPDEADQGRRRRRKVWIIR